MSRDAITQRIIEAGAVAILRMKDSSGLLHVAEALLQGGVTALEVTLTTPNALWHIERLANRYASSTIIGVGSVVDRASARRAIDSGAMFVVSPVLLPEVLEEAHALRTTCHTGSAYAVGGLLCPFPRGISHQDIPGRNVRSVLHQGAACSPARA